MDNIEKSMKGSSIFDQEDLVNMQKREKEEKQSKVDIIDLLPIFIHIGTIYINIILNRQELI
jgi:hypothetical protein